MNLLPTLTCKLKARAGDWAAEGKVELKSLGEKKEEGGRRRRRRKTEEEDDPDSACFK